MADAPPPEGSMNTNTTSTDSINRRLLFCSLSMCSWLKADLTLLGRIPRISCLNSPGDRSCCNRLSRSGSIHEGRMSIA